MLAVKTQWMSTGLALVPYLQLTVLRIKPRGFLKSYVEKSPLQNLPIALQARFSFFARSISIYSPIRAASLRSKKALGTGISDAINIPILSARGSNWIGMSCYKHRLLPYRKYSTFSCQATWWRLASNSSPKIFQQTQSFRLTFASISRVTPLISLRVTECLTRTLKFPLDTENLMSLHCWVDLNT